MGEWKDKAEGTLKETEGKLTNDPERQDQGNAQKQKGNVEGKFNDAKDAIKDRL